MTRGPSAGASATLAARRPAAAHARRTTMGQDYTARKAAKKRRKGEGEGERPSGKQDRPKRGRTGPRRQCMGMCYSAPEVGGSVGEVASGGNAAAAAARRPHPARSRPSPSSPHC